MTADAIRRSFLKYFERQQHRIVPGLPLVPVVRAFELGADDYMTKPFNPQELMARIARLLK